MSSVRLSHINHLIPFRANSRLDHDVLRNHLHVETQSCLPLASNLDTPLGLRCLIFFANKCEALISALAFHNFLEGSSFSRCNFIFSDTCCLHVQLRLEIDREILLLLLLSLSFLLLDRMVHGYLDILSLTDAFACSHKSLLHQLVRVSRFTCTVITGPSIGV